MAMAEKCSPMESIESKSDSKTESAKQIVQPDNLMQKRQMQRRNLQVYTKEFRGVPAG